MKNYIKPNIKKINIVTNENISTFVWNSFSSDLESLDSITSYSFSSGIELN